MGEGGRRRVEEEGGRRREEGRGESFLMDSVVVVAVVNVWAINSSLTLPYPSLTLTLTPH